jgi:hypothetical protein
MDLEMAPGIDFVDELSIQLGRCHAVLVLIGRDWIRLRDAQGRSRLENPEDLVRREIETALARTDVVVVPILIQGTVMPRMDQLPGTMQALARRNALELSDARWSFDVDRLANQLRPKTTIKRAPVVAWHRKRAATAFLGGAAVAWLPTWGILTLFLKLPKESNKVTDVIVKGALPRGVAWAVFAAILAAWAAYTTRAARLSRAATVAFIIAFVGAGVGGAFNQAIRDKVPSFDTAAEILGYVILGAGVTFAAVRTAAPEARAGAFVLGLVAGALCGYLRVRFGHSASGFRLGAEVALQGLAIGSAAFVAVVLSGSRQLAASPKAVQSPPHLTGM